VFACPWQCVHRIGIFAAFLLAMLLAPFWALAAPYADLVMDMRTGEVLHSENADTRLHPASLTKMMTLYIAFEAIERGEISLDSKVTISSHAAAEPPSKLGLRAGQTIALRYLIRAAAIKSANDAATAIGEAIEGSESAFSKRMNRTAKALGMTRTTFANANGLTAKGHLSTARDMAILGRHVFYDFPQYYNLFSRRSADAGIKQVSSTNRRFLDAYEGADGIKTGYTVAAGFNLVASAQRGNKRIIASVFGGQSTAQRNARMAQLLDMGFGKAPNRATVQKPAAPVYVAKAPEDLTPDPAFDSDVAVAAALADGTGPVASGKTLRLNVAVAQSLRPRARPLPGTVPADEEQPALDELLLSSMQDDIAAALEEAQATLGTDTEPEVEDGEAVAVAAADAVPKTVPDTAPSFAQTTEPQPETLKLAAEVAAPAAVATVTPRPAPRNIDVPADPAVDPIDMAAADEAAGPAPATAKPVALQNAAPAPDAVPDAGVVTAVDVGAAVEVAASNVTPIPAPRARPEEIVLASLNTAGPTPEPPLEVVTRVSTSGGRQWAINVGNYTSRYAAERVLLQTALIEMNTLDEALRKVVQRKGGYDANFVGMTEEMAQLACRRLEARQTTCSVVGP
jgi:D-alanyl-D-alanine carboxypeptidase